MRLPDPPLLVITDRHQARRPLEDIAAAVFAGGCRWLSLREKDLAPAERLALLQRLAAIARPYGAIVGIHGTPPTLSLPLKGGGDAVSSDVRTPSPLEGEGWGGGYLAAAGVRAIHLPDGASVAAARASLGRGILIGVSAHDDAGLARAAAKGADYATLSPIFLSASKPGYGPALGLASLARAPLPVLALGGIDATNAAAAFTAGASGVAVMGAAMAVDDPASAVARICAALAARAGAGHS